MEHRAAPLTAADDTGLLRRIFRKFTRTPVRNTMIPANIEAAPPAQGRAMTEGAPIPEPTATEACSAPAPVDVTERWIPKELSWLTFNHRVLQEALEDSTPTIERARFLGIYSNNLDEFYRVRVGGVRRRIVLHQEVGGDIEAMGLLESLQAETLRLNAAFDDAYQTVVRDLAADNVFIRSIDDLDDERTTWLRKYFDRHVRPFVCPIFIRPGVKLDHVLTDDATYLTIELITDGAPSYAVIEVPTDFHSRFIELPTPPGHDCAELVYLDDAIRISLSDLLAGFVSFDTAQAWAMKFTRDAEYDLNEEVDESLLDQLSTVLKERLRAEPTRLSHDRTMPTRVLDMLRDHLGIDLIDTVVAGGRYHNMKDLIAFPSVGSPALRADALEPMIPARLAGVRNYFDEIRKRDVLLHYPYHDFGVFTEWLRQAAMDPNVVSIRISLYRLARSSLVIKALLDAAANGKDVTAVLELTARFDEEANIGWSEVLINAGVRVNVGIKDLKTHSKLCLITRIEDGRRVRYAHVGTGNFNEGTSRIYTDFSVLTAREDLTAEVRSVFGFIDAPYRLPKFEKLWISPLNQRDRILGCFDREIEHSRQGRPARVLAKLNNIADELIVDKIYAAAAAGVSVDLIVRGMCVLVSTLPELGGRLRVISILDRFLEHPRAMVFFNNGSPEVYISSADWMSRNLDNRVEVGCPILDPQHRQTIIDLLELQLRDNTKARIIDGSGENRFVHRNADAPAVRSQLEVRDYLVRRDR